MTRFCSLQGRGRNRRTWSPVVAAIRENIFEFSMESITMPRVNFARELSSAVHDRDHASFLNVLASKPELAFKPITYTSVFMGAQDSNGICSGERTDNRHLRDDFDYERSTSILCQHDGCFKDQPSHDTMDRICLACKEPESISYRLRDSNSC